MAIIPIIIPPDPRLKFTASPMRNVDKETRTLLDDMLETMYAAPGIGLAAPQVGISKRVLVIDLAIKDTPPSPLRIVNPELVWSSADSSSNEEGCLSLPEQFAEVERPENVRVRYLDEHNVSQEVEASGMLSACLQHEMDHLDGRLFVDHLSRLKRNMIIHKLTKIKLAR